jgi:hypothetical protein
MPLNADITFILIACMDTILHVKGLIEIHYALCVDETYELEKVEKNDIDKMLYSINDIFYK